MTETPAPSADITVDGTGLLCVTLLLSLDPPTRSEDDLLVVLWAGFGRWSWMGRL
ncbi:hypothetical protein [Streptomyces dengpaensis]|uniref:hypothetical protein n=1 Tax=Streptomyces dengpaensis TaxID=2049881 RepID=UPI0019D2E78F|nr:hypothetical protein [Streptomyces dengpaensis]